MTSMNTCNHSFGDPSFGDDNLPANREATMPSCIQMEAILRRLTLRFVTLRLLVFTDLSYTCFSGDTR